MRFFALGVFGSSSLQLLLFFLGGVVFVGVVHLLVPLLLRCLGLLWRWGILSVQAVHEFSSLW